MNLQEFSDLMEIPLGGIDIFSCSAVRADFGFPEDVVQETLFLSKTTPLSVSNASHYRLPVRVANRIVSFNLINKAGNFDDIHENVRAILTCIMKKSKIDWIKFILRTIGRPNLRSISYACLISNLLHLKDIPTGNWAFINPSVTPFNMGAINKMLVGNTMDTLRELVYHDPPSSELVFSEKVVELLRDVKAELVGLGKNVDHIPDYRVSSKRKLRKFVASTSSAPPPPPPTSDAPPSPPPAVQSVPSAPRQEDRILAEMAAMSVKQENYAKFMHDGMMMIHEENTYLAKKFDDWYAHEDAVASIQDPPPPSAPGFPFFWPPTSYYVAFPTTARTDDAPGGSGAGPSGTGGDAGAGPSTAGGDDDAGPSGATADEPMDS